MRQTRRSEAVQCLMLKLYGEQGGRQGELCTTGSDETQESAGNLSQTGGMAGEAQAVGSRSGPRERWRGRSRQWMVRGRQR